MIKLSKREINKIKGFAHYYSESYEQAITYLEKVKNDAHVYEIIAYSYMNLREYKLAQEYALKAIELGRESAYIIYTRVTTANLARSDQAYQTLLCGIKKHSAQACISLANMGLDFSGSQQRQLYAEEKMDLLEKAWKYSRQNQKGLNALNIALTYKGMTRPNCVLNELTKEECEIRAGKYFRLANEFHSTCVGTYNEYMFTCLNEKTPRKERNLILNSLFEHFDYHAALYFGLMLTQNSTKNPSCGGEAWMLFNYGVSKGDNACALVYGLICGSNMKGSSFNLKNAKELLQIIYADKRLINVPLSLKETYLSLIGQYDSQLNTYLKELKQRIYDPK